MNENARKWVAALRSGKFEQTTGALRRGDSYCCLGVACEVYRREAGAGAWEDDCGDYVFRAEREESDHRLPIDVADWLRLRTSTGAAGEGSPTLAGRNDDGAPLTEIADIIESEPEGLFA